VPLPSSSPVAPSPSSSLSSLSPVANFVLVVSHRAVSRHAVECLCRSAAADARDDATSTRTVLLR
jgi:hypothetical protein